MSDASSPIDIFLTEAGEIVDSLEEHLLELESNPHDADRIGAVFRNLHTLKGSGEMFGFTALSHFVHHFENAYDAVRSGRAFVTLELVNLSLRARDHISRLIEIGNDTARNASMKEDPETKNLLVQIEAFLESESQSPRKDAAGGIRKDVEAREERFSIRFAPGPDAFRNGMRPDILFDELALLGLFELTCLVDDVPALDDLDATACHLTWAATLSTDKGRAAIDDIFIFADEGSVVIMPTSEKVPASDDGPASPSSKGLPASQSNVAPAAKGGSASAGGAKTESVRVQSFRLDQLMDQLGELVIAQARLNRIAEESGEPSLTAVAEEIERLVTGLRDATLSIRMVPIGTVFARFRRLVRDLSVELGKDVELVTEGGQTELDKNVIDSLGEPLVHLIRNSIDHGIENAERRQDSGKPSTAVVKISAEQLGGEVLIRISDDGAGLDVNAIRKRAVDRGLIAEDSLLSNEAIFDLIFEPGFSTAATISNVSGRGVGMDAVRAVISELRGSVEVASEAGIGTTITLRLPLTLAIIDGLLVRVAGGVFVIPLASVMECVDLPQEERCRESGRAILRIRDQLVPFVAVSKLFGLGEEHEAGDRVVVISSEGKRFGLIVDDIIGQHHTVIKSLSLYHRGIPGLAGGTILGDGSVALILDPSALLKSDHAKKAEAA